MADDTHAGRFLAYHLRHHPEAAGIVLDKRGWARTEDLISDMNLMVPMSMDRLERIVATDNKQRYAFNDDHTLIRANQGHSISVDVELETVKPSQNLFHATAQKSLASILQEGLLLQSLLFLRFVFF